MEIIKQSLQHVTLMFLIVFTPVPQILSQHHLSSDNSLKSHIDSLIHHSILPFLENDNRVGLSLALYYEGEEYFYNYGSRQKKTISVPTKRTLYEIGSITKTFGGMLLAQAVLDEKVKLDDDIRLYLDDYYPNLEFQGSPIKLFHLLNHSSGLPFDFIDRSGVESANADSLVFALAEIENNYSKEQLYSDLHTVKLDTIPGVELNYSNAAMQLLSFILEEVYQKPYSELISEFITSPANMNHTTFEIEGGKKENVAKGYNENGLLMPHFKNGAAGGLYSTTEDLIKYGKLHLDEKNPVIAFSHEPTWGQIEYFAFGLNWQMQLKENNYRRIWQSGGTAGFTSLLVVYPGLDIVVVLLSNQSDENSEGELSLIENKIIHQLIGK